MQNRLIAQGYDCCWNGAVQELTRIGAATYQARISIEENYAVTLKLDASGAILWTHCKCTCSHSPCCKHIAAAYVALAQLK